MNKKYVIIAAAAVIGVGAILIWSNATAKPSTTVDEQTKERMKEITFTTN